MKLVWIINPSAYSRLSNSPSLSKLRRRDQTKRSIRRRRRSRRDHRWHICLRLAATESVSLKRENTITVFSLYCFYPREHDIAVFTGDTHRANSGVAGVCDIINNTVRMKGCGAPPPPPSPSISPLSPLSPCYSSMLNTSASAFACVAWIYMNVSPARDNGGQVIDMCGRTLDKQPTPTGVTPACLIHFDWAKTEGWSWGWEGKWNWGRLKSRDEMTATFSLFFCFIHLVLLSAENRAAVTHTRRLAR